MALITTQDLKEMLQQLCKEHEEIVDIQFYSTTGKNGITISKIVVIEIAHYNNFNNSIHVHSFTTVERALAHYMPKTDFQVVSSKTSLPANTLIST